jgi:hypothetical protein
VKFQTNSNNTTIYLTFTLTRSVDLTQMSTLQFLARLYCHVNMNGSHPWFYDYVWFCLVSYDNIHNLSVWWIKIVLTLCLFWWVKITVTIYLTGEWVLAIYLSGEQTLTIYMVIKLSQSAWWVNTCNLLVWLSWIGYDWFALFLASNDSSLRMMLLWLFLCWLWYQLVRLFSGLIL